MEESVGGFRFLPHTADVMIESWGSSLEEAFGEAAKALFEVITDTNSVAPSIEVDLRVCGYDLENLLYKWLEELLYYHDTKNMVFSRFYLEYIREEGSGSERQYCLYGRALGEEFNRDKHEPRTVVKAVTYHQMKIWREDDLYHLTVVVDI